MMTKIKEHNHTFEASGPNEKILLIQVLNF